jgi:phage terminase large subunit
MTRRRIHRFTPRGAALDAFHARDTEVVLAGPAGTGKSRGALEKLHTVALKYPGMRGLIVRQTLASLGASALRTWRRDVAADHFGRGLMDFYGGSAEEPPQYRYSNGSAIAIGGMDKPSKIMSTEYDMIYVQEATELALDGWEACTTRLRSWVMPYQQLLADCNPSSRQHWLKRRAEAGVTLMLHSRHHDNPRLYADDGTLTERGEQYMAQLDALTGVRRKRLRDGLWVAAEGVILEDWDEDVHIVPRFVPPADWRRVWSVDFGYTNPFVLQRWAFDPDGRAYLYAERYLSRRLVEDHARAVLAEVQHDDGTWREPIPQTIVCDHDAEDRATLERHLGLPTRPADKRVSVGLEAVATRLRRAGDSRPRLYVMEGARTHAPDSELATHDKPTDTAAEIPGYVWDPRALGAPRETPLKEDDHGCDAMRYLVMDADHGVRVRVRWSD